MSSFYCVKCGTAIIDSPNGYITGCEHYPTALQAENKRLREALEYAVRFYKECIDTKSEPDITEWVEIFEQALGE